MTALTCALCGRIQECIAKEINGQEYDICSGCWSSLAKRLKGKGRPANHRVAVVSRTDVPRHEPDEKPFPGEPPKVWLSDTSN